MGSPQPLANPSSRIKTLRLAKGFSQEDLVTAVGGIVSKQALSKYETGKMKPSLTVARQLAIALGVKTIHLLAEPRFAVEFLAYRNKSSMLVRDKEQLESYVQVQLERRAAISSRLGSAIPAHSDAYSDAQTSHLPRFTVRTLQDVEQAAKSLRQTWDLGLDAISSITDTLESHRIHVLNVDASTKFDGISAVVHDDSGEVIAAGVVSRTGVSGERQRMNLTHELGHLVLDTQNLDDELDDEKAAKRFAGAFLMPDDAVRLELGEKRPNLSHEELFIIKKRFGISVQAIVMRAADLGIINADLKTRFFKYAGQNGWRTQEPQPFAVEEPQRWKQIIARGLSERLLTIEEASPYLSAQELESAPPEVLRAQMRHSLPLEERQRQMRNAAEQMIDYYAPGHEGAEWAEEFVREGLHDDT
jgi:Zn-dependent peptidase ImmA (M78 family)/transcriptional regulator with XRE-family HTH domain